MTDPATGFKPVTFVSQKLGTRVYRKGRGFFQFVNGTLTIKTPEELEEFQALLNEFTGSSVSLIRRLDEDNAKKIAQKHRAAMVSLKGQIIQGVATAAHRAQQISEVTTQLKKTEAAHMNIALQNAENLGGQGQLGIVEPGDMQNPSPELVTEKVVLQAQSGAPATQVENVPTPSIKIGIRRG